MNNRKGKYFFPVFILSACLCFSQHKLNLINTDSSSIFPKLKYKREFSAKDQLLKELNSLVRNLQADGYLLASADILHSDSLVHTLFLFIGKRYEFASLRKGNADAGIIAETGFSEKFYAGRTFKPTEVRRLIEKMLVYYENHGYPFASVKLDSVEIKDNSINAALNVQKHKYIKIDSILIQGDLKLSKTFLHRYLDIKPGSPYSEQAIRNISSRLKLLPFVSETRPVMVRLTESTNKIYLFANKRNASLFDGVIGLLPSPAGKTIFTGDAKIRLQNNVFKAGETIELNWRRLQTQTQDLRTRIIYPFMFNTPVGVDYALKLYRRDTTFIDVLNNIGLQYLFSGLNNVKAFYRQRNSSILSTASLAGITTLPDYADITTKAYGLGFFFEQLDYKLNPRKGFSVTLNASAGTRKIKKNPKLNEIVYNGIELKSTQYQGDIEASYFIPVLKRSAVKLGVQSAAVASDQVFRNELFRIGGLRTLRGFDEESIFASSYAIGTVEYRFLFNENSAIFLFADGAWYERSSVGGYLKDTPLGVGAGISFDTKAGIFSLNYALGNQLGNGFDFRAGKIHFGIVNAF